MSSNVMHNDDALMERRGIHPIHCNLGEHGDFAPILSLMQSEEFVHAFWEYLKGENPWVRLRRRLRLRAIVLYWLELSR